MRSVIAYAPGRVNLIGEHTDYNGGFVMPMAIGLGTQVEAREREAEDVVVRSSQFTGDVRVFRLDALAVGSQPHWSDYVRGMLVELQREGVTLRGAELEITSTLPVGAGLSSSAALLVSSALSMLALAQIDIDRVRLAQIAQRAENLHAGAHSGIMDQFVSANAVAGCALLLDTRSLAFEQLPMPARAEVVICNTMVKHALAGSEYNRRREECEAATAVLAHRFGVTSLRDVTLEQLFDAKDELGDLLYRRARHVITENVRVLEAKDALQRNDLLECGAVMNASHTSLKNDYEVSCDELDTMVDVARACDGVYGARMTGGGFGGCAIALAEADRVGTILQTVRREYAQRSGVVPDVYVMHAFGGATVA